MKKYIKSLINEQTGLDLVIYNDNEVSIIDTGKNEESTKFWQNLKELCENSIKTLVNTKYENSTKSLSDITKDEVEHICELLGEPYIDYMTNSNNKWKGLNLEVQIHTTSTMNNNKDDSCIWIYNDGQIRLHRNNGDWGGSRDIPINTVPVLDYLRNCGYSFKIK